MLAKEVHTDVGVCAVYDACFEASVERPSQAGTQLLAVRSSRVERVVLVESNSWVEGLLLVDHSTTEVSEDDGWELIVFQTLSRSELLGTGRPKRVRLPYATGWQLPRTSFDESSCLECSSMPRLKLMKTLADLMSR
jgi:hypothetical protein